MATRRELKDAIRQRYQAATERRERRQILAEFVRVTGYHRKHALRVLNHSSRSAKPRRRERLYDEAVHQALAVLWEAADRICGKRLRVLIPVLIQAMERHGHLQLDRVVRSRLLDISAGGRRAEILPQTRDGADQNYSGFERFLIAHEIAHLILKRDLGAGPIGHGEYWEHENLW